jgi:hypothetical protein
LGVRGWVLGKTLNLERGTLNWRNPYPHQHLTVFVDRRLFDRDDFFLEGVKSVLIEIKL